MTENTSLVELAEQMDVHPDDLDEHGVLKPYVAPELAPYPPAQYPDTEQPTRCEPSPGDEPLSIPRIGWCPNGSISGGICSPFNNERPNWMGYYSYITAHLRIDEMILAGTHNSGSDKQAPHKDSYSTCQDVSPHTQLQTGIRVLDLRVRFYSGYSDGDSRKFQIYHGISSGRTVRGDILQAAMNLYNAHPKEVMILDFHEFINFTEAAHRELASIINTTLGNRIIEPRLKYLVLGQLWILQKNVVIAYDDNQRDPKFWPGVNQRWIGRNSPSSDELRDFIRAVAEEARPDFELRAIQAHKYTKVGQPDDMSPDVMNWFAGGAADKPIMKFYIINTDWSLRHRHIDNCIGANRFRNTTRTFIHLTPNDLPNGNFIPQHYDAITLETFNGNWSTALTLPYGGRDKATVLIVCKAQLNTTLQHSYSDNFPVPQMTLAQGNALLFIYSAPQSKWILQPDARYSPDTAGNTIPNVRANEKYVEYLTGDGNWAEHVNLPTSAPAYSYVKISCHALYSSLIHRRPEQRVYRSQRGDTYIFMLDDQDTWQIVDPPIHSYGAVKAGAQMADTGTEQTRVLFQDGDWIAQITLPHRAWQDDEVRLSSGATLEATVMGTNLESGTPVQLKTRDTLFFRYNASTSKWRLL